MAIVLSIILALAVLIFLVFVPYILGAKIKKFIDPTWASKDRIDWAGSWGLGFSFMLIGLLMLFLLSALVFFVFVPLFHSWGIK